MLLRICAPNFLASPRAPAEGVLFLRPAPRAPPANPSHKDPEWCHHAGQSSLCH
jgi:hypothetical protein